MRTIQFFKLLCIFEIFPNKMLEKKNFFLRFYLFDTERAQVGREGEKEAAGSVLSRGAGSPLWGWIPGPGDHIT